MALTDEEKELCKEEGEICSVVSRSTMHKDLVYELEVYGARGNISKKLKLNQVHSASPRSVAACVPSARPHSLASHTLFPTYSVVGYNFFLLLHIGT